MHHPPSPTARHAVLVASLLAVSACIDSPVGPEQRGLMAGGPAFSLAGSTSGYTVIELGSMGGLGSVAIGINIHGQVVGYSMISNMNGRAFLWQDGSMIDLGVFGLSDRGGQNFSLAHDINDAGQVVGWSTQSDGHFRAFLWENGSMTSLGVLPGQLSSWATAINNSAQIIGMSGDRVFLWESGVMTALGGFGDSYTWPWAYAMNNAGQVVGGAATAAGGQRAFLWANGVVKDLGTLGGDYSFAYSINDAGQVVGAASDANGSYRAFLWEEGKGMVDLGLMDGTDAAATSINNVGQVVGWEWREDTGNRAFIWQDGVMTFLGAPPGGEPHFPSSINDLGQVAGARERPVLNAILWKKPTPQEILQGGVDEIVALLNLGVLNQGEAAALINTLNTAVAMLNDGRTTPAVNQLQAFIMRVERMIATGKLTAGEGQPLIDAARAVINST
jgi:probable HAF family extracellular repeat protein